MYRYKNGWNELTTSVTGTDSTYVNYEADTRGFSSFAIGVKSGVVVEEEVPEEAPAEVPRTRFPAPPPVLPFDKSSTERMDPDVTRPLAVTVRLESVPAITPELSKLM